MTETLWVHAAPPSDPAAIGEYIETLEHIRPGLIVTATGDGCPDPRRSTPGPGNNRLAQKGFLDRLQPDVAVMTGRLDSTLAAVLGRSGIPALWLDATPPQRRWPRLGRANADTPGVAFAHVLAPPGLDSQRLGRTGAGRLETPGLLSPSTPPLPYSVAERDTMAERLAGRPVWMASAPAPDEVPALLDAHRAALRQSHRLLLILAVPAETGEAIAAYVASEGWHAARRRCGDDPGPEDQLLIADELDELGLWYRLAPMTFLGGTLLGGPPRRAPFEAAALGSALLHGPHAGPFAAEFDRLTRARASRRIDHPDALSRAVARMLSADIAAGLATAAWDVVTAGAPAMNRAIHLTEALLDKGPAP